MINIPLGLISGEIGKGYEQKCGDSSFGESVWKSRRALQKMMKGNEASEG